MVFLLNTGEVTSSESGEARAAFVGTVSDARRPLVRG